MPRSKVRGGRKAHNKRIAKRKEKMNADFKAIDDLKRKIFEEAKQRYLDKQSGSTEGTFRIDV